MLTADETTLNIINSPVRSIKARVELYNSSSTLVNTFNYDGALINFTVNRVGEESKFFGFGVCQKINIHLIDTNRDLSITTENYFKVIYTIDEQEITPYPNFYVTEVHRDENTNELSITAYDALNTATSRTAADMTIGEEDATIFTIQDYILAASGVLGLTVAPVITASGEWQNLSYLATTDVNFEGTETIRDVLDDIAEITYTIYYIDNSGALHFKRLDNTTPVTIDKTQYFSLSSGDNRRLTTVSHITELADNLTAATDETGTTQYIRNNAFIDLNVDNTTLILEDIISALGGFTINQFECEWRGNPLVEIGEALKITTKDDNTVISYVINDTIKYNGCLSEKSSWSYEDSENEENTNATTLGEALKETFAKVDKASKNITLLTSQTESNNEAITELQLETSGISASVINNQTTIEEITGNINEIQEEVSAKMTSDAVEIAINKAISNGVDTVTTSTGFTFNDDGLTIAKTDSEMSTTIDENGMVVSNSSEEVLTATSEGVNAINLTARKYLIIGTNSRFEDYNNSTRTGCFWIGG